MERMPAGRAGPGSDPATCADECVRMKRLAVQDECVRMKRLSFLQGATESNACHLYQGKVGEQPASSCEHIHRVRIFTAKMLAICTKGKSPHAYASLKTRLVLQ